ncbi:MAG: hypothetical protein D6730_21060 [Bacteroidetes bacterium]|nr:MAG: hypothetical protein D6730_21060 [Bacteroidota bacterium]
MRFVNRPKHTATKEKATKKKGLKAHLVDDYLRFVLFLALIGMVYIWNSHYAERQMKEMSVLKKEVKSLKSKYLEKRSMLSAGTQFTQIKHKADSLGLRKYREPAFKLIKK